MNIIKFIKSLFSFNEIDAPMVVVSKEEPTMVEKSKRKVKKVEVLEKPKKVTKKVEPSEKPKKVTKKVVPEVKPKKPKKVTKK